MKFLVSLLSTPAILLAVVSMIGLISQRKNPTEVFTGTAKTAIGFLIFGIGATTMTGTLQNFNKLFTEGFHINGVIASPEAATALAQDKFGFAVSMTLIIGFIMNLVFARITPFKNVFFTGGHSLFFACVLALVMKANGFNNTWTIVVGGTILGFCSAALPQLCQPFMRKITGGDFQAIGHFNMFGYALSGLLGNFFKKHVDDTTENIKFPKALSFFKDFLMGFAFVMLILFYIAAIAAGKPAVMKISGGVDWLVFPLVQALTCTAGISVLMTGVRMFLAEITAAFNAFAEKFIPGSRPALDVPTIFPFALLCSRTDWCWHHDCLSLRYGYYPGSTYLFLLWRNRCDFWQFYRRMARRSFRLIHRWPVTCFLTGVTISCNFKYGCFNGYVPEC